MNDQLIIQRIKSGQTELLSSVYTDNRSEFINWIIKEYRAEMEEAKDLYQATILIFYNNIRTGKLHTLSGTIKTYLFAVGRNQYLKNRNKNKKQFNIIDDILNPEFDGDEEERMEIENKYQVVESSLKLLGENCKRILELTYFTRSPMSEIASLMGYSNADTAKNMRYKCMQKLKKLVGQQMAVLHE